MNRKILQAITGSGGVVFNQYAKRYIDAIQNDIVPTTLTSYEKTAINNFVVGLLGLNALNANFFRPDNPSISILRVVNPVITNSLSAIKYNLVDPTAYTAIVYDTPLVTKKHGIKLNGTSQYLDLVFNPSLHMGVNTGGLTIYNRNGVQSSAALGDVGAYLSGTQGFSVSNRRADLHPLGICWQDGTLHYPAIVINGAGIATLSRVSTTSSRLYRNGVQISEKTTTAATTKPNMTCTLGRVNGVAYSNGEYLYFDINAGIPYNIIADYHALIDQLQVDLQRNFVKDGQYVAMGDSITEGYYATGFYGYAKILRDYLDYPLYLELASSGRTLVQMVTAYNTVKASSILSTATITICAGSNDTIDATWNTNYDNFVAQMIADGISAQKIILMTPPYQLNRIAQNAQINIYIQAIATSRGCKYVNQCDDIHTADGHPEGDYLHPGDAGHLKMMQNTILQANL